jgi:hypothetical protein
MELVTHKQNKYIRQGLEKINISTKKTKHGWLEYLGGGGIWLQTESQNRFISINGKAEYANNIKIKKRGSFIPSNQNRLGAESMLFVMTFCLYWYGYN